MKIGVFTFCTLCILSTAALAETKVEPPVPVRTVSPDYPEEMRRDHVAGVVMVKVSLDDQGNVVSAEVEKSSNAAFDRPAIEALKKWRFKPARQDGNPVAVKLKVPIKFNSES